MGFDGWALTVCELAASALVKDLGAQSLRQVSPDIHKGTAWHSQPWTPPDSFMIQLTTSFPLLNVRLKCVIWHVDDWTDSLHQDCRKYEMSNQCSLTLWSQTNNHGWSNILYIFVFIESRSFLLWSGCFCTKFKWFNHKMIFPGKRRLALSEQFNLKTILDFV